MPKLQTKTIMIFSLFFLFALFAAAKCAEAANHYVRQGASGNGADWTNAYGSLPTALTRGDTYYIADGNYGSYIFDDANSGSTFISIKKGVLSDHGTETGWSAAYGDGQAVFAAPLIFRSSYYTFDGNGTHTIPSKNPSDYGFKIYSSAATDGDLLFIGAYGEVVKDITIRYTHLHHLYSSKDLNTNNGSIYLSAWSNGPQYIKIQNNFVENSGQNGYTIGSGDSHHILIERNYNKNLGELHNHTPDYHGQTIQQFSGSDDIVVRYNVFEACEGQALWALHGAATTNVRSRFYGNLVFNGYGLTGATAGFNSTGGVVGHAGAWPEKSDEVYIYNNTMVNIGGEYGMYSGFHFGAGNDIADNVFIYNNLQYNNDNVVTTPVGNSVTAMSHNASGGSVEAFGGTSEQKSVASTIFNNYIGNNFRLTGHTAAGINLSAQEWWSVGADSFFGQLDYATDMFGTTRSSWDRGAFEYAAEGGDTTPPAAPRNITIQ